jgi:hypothetical protein
VFTHYRAGDVAGADRPIYACRPVASLAAGTIDTGSTTAFMPIALRIGPASVTTIFGLAESRMLARHEGHRTDPPGMAPCGLVGTGAGDKTQVQHMVGILLNLSGRLQADAADALAIALAHAHTRASIQRIGIPRSAWRRRR